jgi:hypothetical protein
MRQRQQALGQTQGWHPLQPQLLSGVLPWLHWFSLVAMLAPLGSYHSNFSPAPWEDCDFMNVLWSPLSRHGDIYVPWLWGSRTFVLFAFAKGRYLPHVKSVSHCNSVLTVMDLVLLCQKENMKENKDTARRDYTLGICLFQDAWG